MKINYLVLALVLFAGSLAFAQGSGSTEGNVASSDDFKVTRSIEGKITQIKADGQVIVIEDKKGERHSLHYSDQTKIASSKSESADKSLKMSALKPGDKVKVEFRPSDSRAVKLRLLE